MADLPPPPSGESDLFRDTPVRLLGYCNEVGEAFKRFASRKVYLGSYLVSTGYCLGDAADKGRKTAQSCAECRGPPATLDPGAGAAVTIPATLGGGGGAVAVAETVAEVLVWQGLASVAIPGFTINRVVAGTTWLLNQNTSVGSGRLRAALPTAVGLISIPFIIFPIDRGVDEFMHHVYRPVVAKARS